MGATTKLISTFLAAYILIVGAAVVLSDAVDLEDELKSDSFEDLGHIKVGPAVVEGKLRILQITDLHRFPKGGQRCVVDLRF